MNCPECDADLVAFAVPEDLQEYAPGDTAVAAICSNCLRVQSVSPDRVDVDEAFERVADYFPPNEAGVAMALALGMLDTLALNRTAIETLCARVEREGADPLLTLDRLATDEDVNPHFDIDSRRVQLEEFLS